MSTARNRGRLAVTAVAVGASLALAGCASGGDPLDSGSGGETETDTITIGSQAYYSNEIIAEIYAQALEEAGYTVERQFNIGQRDAYIPSLEDGSLSLFPEYTGNLLQFYDAEATATKPDEVYAALEEALPEGLTALDYSPAADQDSYNVTSEFAEANDLTTLADLADVSEPIVLGGAPELEERPYGPDGLKSVYGVDVEFQPTADTTVESLVEGTINLANVYTADPSIQANDFVTLEDPEGLFLASNVVPIANADIAEEIAEVINPISAALDTEALVALNVKSTADQESSDQIATDWLTENGFLE